MIYTDLRVDARKGDCGWKVIDMDTGLEIPWCVWADCVSGTYGVIAYGGDGRPLVADNEAVTNTKTGRIGVMPA